MGDLNPFERDMRMFADLIAFNGVQDAHQGSSSFDHATTSSTETSSNPFQVATKDPDDDQLAINPNPTSLPADDIECTPAPESTTGDDGGQPLGGKKRRRSRNSPEPDYSEIIVELNKKRKRAAQTCDRCKVCYLQR